MSDCVMFGGSISDQGYGRVYVGGGKWRRAHRMAWLLSGRTIPKGKQLDHLCRNRACVNIEHLELVTSRENTLRGEGPTAKNAKKDSCVNGHPFTTDNLLPRYGRCCRLCQRQYHAAYKLRKRAAFLAQADARSKGAG